MTMKSTARLSADTTNPPTPKEKKGLLEAPRISVIEKKSAGGGSSGLDPGDE